MNYLTQNKEVTRMFDLLEEEDITRLMNCEEEYVIFEFESHGIVATPSDYDENMERIVFNDGGFFLDKEAFFGLFKRSNSFNSCLTEAV